MKAFPTTKPLDSWDDPHQGMDLRDYFAAKAMQGLIIAEIESCKYFKPDRPWKWFDIDMNEEDLTDLAKRTFDLADAMMKAREQ